MTELRSLVGETLIDPQKAARRLIDMQLDPAVLWTGLLLAAILNTILFTISNLILPSASPFPAAFNAPFVFLLVAAGALVLTVHALFWTGRAFGGKGQLADLLVTMVWLQFLRIAVQAIALVLLLIAPTIASFLVLIATLAGIWIFVHFINAAHRFSSVFMAILVLIAGTLAVVMGLVFLLSLIGISSLGSAAYV